MTWLMCRSENCVVSCEIRRAQARMVSRGQMRASPGCCHARRGHLSRRPVLPAGLHGFCPTEVDHLFVRLITLASGAWMRSGSAWEPMLPLRDMQGPSEWASLAGEDARPCLTAGLPREEAFGVCSPAAAEAGTRSGACLGLRTSPNSLSRPALAPLPCMRGAHASPFKPKRYL